MTIYCTATKNNGQPCKKKAYQDNVCYAHLQTPEAKAARSKAASIAGKTVTYIPKGKAIEIKDSRDLHKYLAQILTGMSKGTIKLTTAHLKVVANIGKLFVQTEEKAVILNRLEKLETTKE